MSRSQSLVPGSVPVLSRGKHRNARKGACFMEFAAYLAGEPWSDHPRCTHPLLSELARMVNDHTSDAARGRLVEHVPSVIGLTSDDVLVDARIALRSATTALPIAAAETQNVMAVSILMADRVLADREGRAWRIGEGHSGELLEQAPHAARWALRVVGMQPTSIEKFRQHSAPNTVRIAVRGIAEACIPDPDTVLRTLLLDSIREVEAISGRHTPTGALPAAVSA